MTPFKKRAYLWSTLKRACQGTNKPPLLFLRPQLRLRPLVLDTLTELNLFEQVSIQPKAYGDRDAEDQESGGAWPCGPRLAEQLPHIFVCGLLRSGEYGLPQRSEEHTSELQSHSFISYAVFCL